MPSGRIDAVTPGGYIEGWAIDEDQPLQPMQVAVADTKGVIIARGHANLFRDDLVNAGVGGGWSAFRLKAVNNVSLKGAELILLDVVGKAVLHVAGGLVEVEDQAAASDITGLVLTDPTVISSAAQLRGCFHAFNGYAAEWGVEAFVRAAFVYVLRRPPDPPGLENYARMLTDGSISPLGVIYALHNSDEFAGAPAALASPSSSGFPFRKPRK